MSRVVLGVTAGIAAYRAAYLVRRLREAGFEVRVAMTPRAASFVGPLTFSALTGHSVLIDDFDSSSGGEIAHVEWARWCRAVLVAPATADFLGRFAHGLADDALTCLLLALEPDRPVILAPAMNTQMWRHPSVRANVDLLRRMAKERPLEILEPVEKRLACGEVGPGGLPSAEELVASVRRHVLPS